MKNEFLKIVGSLLMVGALAVTFAACGGGGDNPGKTPATKTHDQTTHVITGSDKTQHHNFVDGKCTMCAQTTIFRQDPMSKSKDILSTAQAQQGTLESVWYKTRAYGVEAKFKGKKDINDKDYDDSALWIYKRAYVYLPYGYSKEDTSKKYNVMYMMHGDKLNEGYWFASGDYKPSDSNYTGGYGTENVLDYLKANGKSEDTIYVAMTMYQYYTGSAKTKENRDTTYVGGAHNNADISNVYSGYVSEDGNDKVDFDFGYSLNSDGNDSEIWKEWKYHLMPTIATRYNTYADASSIATKMADETNHGLTEDDAAFFTACESARGHVAYTGLSRGGASVNSVLGNALEYISYFAYESAFTPNADVIKNMKDKAESYPVNYLFMSCGSMEGPESTDSKMLEIRNEMGWQQKEGSDIKNGDRIEFVQVNGTGHNYQTWITNLFNFAQVAFKAPAGK